MNKFSIPAENLRDEVFYESIIRKSKFAQKYKPQDYYYTFDAYYENCPIFNEILLSFAFK
ncbi:MAG: hypothetical protein ACOCXG_04600 [Nanoarchaeota archaeon]